MLQEENIMPAETFTANSGDVETTRYMGHQWQEVARKTVKFGHLMAELDFVRYQSWLGWLLELSVSELVMQHSGSEST